MGQFCFFLSPNLWASFTLFKPTKLRSFCSKGFNLGRFWFMEMGEFCGGALGLFVIFLGTLFGRDFGDSCSMKSFEDQK